MEKQIDLFNDFEQARVFTCIAGAYIGHFNPQDEENPVTRLSEYFDSEEAAEEALERQTWLPCPDID